MNKENMPMVKMYMISFCSKKNPGKVEVIHFDSAEVLLDFKNRLEQTVGDDLFINYAGEVNIAHTISDNLIKEIKDLFE